MRSKVSLKTRTYLVASPPFIELVYLRTLCRFAYSLQNGCFTRICPSNNKDTELKCRNLGVILLCIHDVGRKMGQGAE